MPKTYLALDYGTKRIGLAIGNDLLLTAQAIQPISTKQLHTQEGTLVLDTLSGLVKEWKISHLVLGLPLDAKGKATPLSKRIQKLGRKLNAELKLPVSFTDERYTSASADKLLRQNQLAGKRFSNKKIALRDSVAAQLILETYFSEDAGV